MLGSCLQGGSDDTVGAGPTDVKEESPKQGPVGDEAQPASEFCSYSCYIMAPAILKPAA